MKHAVMIMGYGEEAPIVQQTINMLDDEDIDFFIHWDAKYALPKLYSSKSSIYFLKNRISVRWGTYSQIQATIALLRESYHGEYEYYHLISSNDGPLVNGKQFKKFFTKEIYLGFDSKVTNKEINRIRYYYPENVDFRKHKLVLHLFTLSNYLLRINRLKKYKKLNVKKGTNWFSIRKKYVPEILNTNMGTFRHGVCADEIFMQTIFSRFENSIQNGGTARYIDWKKGNPYTFEISDIDWLRRIRKTGKYVFFRKVSDPNLILKLFDKN